MKVSATDIAALHAFLIGDFDHYDRLVSAYDDGEGEGEGFAVLLAAAFKEGIDRRFSPTWSAADVVLFVSQARIGLNEGRRSIDPHAAERLVRTMLDDRPLSELDDSTKALQIPLLLALVADANFSTTDLDEFLNAARRRAGAVA